MLTDLKIQKQISETVSKELERRKWSRYRLYKESKTIPKSSLYSMLDNKTKWSVKYLTRVSTVLGISFESLMFQSENYINQELLNKCEEQEKELLVLRDKVATYEAVIDFSKIKKTKK